MNDKRKIGTALILAVITLVALAALTAPASAYYNWEGFPMTPGNGYSATHGNGTWISNYTLNGSVYYDGGHGLANPPYDQTYTLPNFDNMLFAHVYMYVWGANKDERGWEQMNFTNATGVPTVYDKLWLNATADTNKNAWISTCGAHVIWHNVTNNVTSGDNTASIRTGKVTTGFDGRVDNLHMLAVYKDDNLSEIKVWVAQGHDALCHAYGGDPDHDYGIAYFEGDINTSKWLSATLYTAFEAGDSGKPDTISFNDNLLCTDCANSSTYPPYMDLEVLNIPVGWLNATGGQHVDWYRDGDDYQHNINVMLVLSTEEPKPNLVVEKIGEPTLADHNYTLAVVANQTYTVNATIKNNGAGSANASQANLSEDGNVKDTQSVPGLGFGGTAEIQFSWMPSSNGTKTLTVTADSGGVITESNENDNVSSKDVYVYAAGTANEDDDLVMTQNDMTFLPTFELHAANDTTTVVVNITNNGTGSVTSAFTVELDVPGTAQDQTKTITSGVKAKAVKVTSFIYNASKGGPYAVNVTLDAGGTVNETSEGNNDATKPLTVVRVRIMDSHHYGNTSAYNGSLSNNQTVEMFDVTRLVPQNCSTWDVLNSVANVKSHPSPSWSPNTYVYGIDGLEEMPSHPTEGSIYWYQYVNGIYVPLNQKCADYKLSDGETMHWDLHRWVDSGFNPRPVMAWNDLYPEPMTHGYFNMTSQQTMMWNTTIVYPNESSQYQKIAEDVKAKLVSRGTPSARISIETDDSVTGDQKNDTNLVLLGQYEENNLTAEINPHHQKFAMVVYFNTTKMIDDYTNTEYSIGGVVQACDNPYDNQPLGSMNSHNDEGPVIYMATGLTDKYAQLAAKMLWCETDKLISFWVLQTPPHNLDINTSRALAEQGNVTITWEGSADAYDIYVTDNYATGFGGAPTVEDVTTTYWDDTNAYSSPIYANLTQRYYKVVNANESADAYSEVVGKYDVKLAVDDSFMSVPHWVSVTDINEVLKYSNWPGTRLEGGSSLTADKLYAFEPDGSSQPSAYLTTSGTWSASLNLQSNKAIHIGTKKGTHYAPTNATLRLFLYR